MVKKKRKKKRKEREEKRQEKEELGGGKKRWKKDVRGWSGMKKRRRGFAEPGAPTS